MTGRYGHARGFLKIALLAASSIVAISLKETVPPRRVTWSDGLYLIPVVIFLRHATWPKCGWRWSQRLVGGGLLGLALLVALTEDRDLVQDDAADPFLRLALYPLGGALLALVVSLLVNGILALRRPAIGYCRHCG